MLPPALLLLNFRWPAPGSSGVTHLYVCFVAQLCGIQNFNEQNNYQ